LAQCKGSLHQIYSHPEKIDISHRISKLFNHTGQIAQRQIIKNETGQVSGGIIEVITCNREIIASRIKAQSDKFYTVQR